MTKLQGNRANRLRQELQDAPLTRFPRLHRRVSSQDDSDDHTVKTYSAPPKRAPEPEVRLINGANEAGDEVPISILRRALPARFERIEREIETKWRDIDD